MQPLRSWRKRRHSPRISNQYFENLLLQVQGESIISLSTYPASFSIPMLDRNSIDLSISATLHPPLKSGTRHPYPNSNLPILSYLTYSLTQSRSREKETTTINTVILNSLPYLTLPFFSIHLQTGHHIVCARYFKRGIRNSIHHQ